MLIANSSLSLRLDVGLLEAEVLLLVNHLEVQTEQQSGDTQAGKDYHGPGIVILRRVGDTRVGLVEHIANQHGEEPQTDVLNPENQSVGRTDYLGVNQLGVAALILGFVLKVVDKKKGIGLELPNITE